MTKVEQIQNRIDELTTAINAGDSDVQLTLWEMERTEKIKELAAEEAQQQDAQVQQQAQVAQTDGLKEIIRSIRDAVYLKELMDRALGLTENATATQDFNSMVDQAVDEDLSTLYTVFQQQLEQRDERFRALTSQALDVQNQLDKANLTIQSQAEVIQTHEKTIADFANKFADDGNALQQKDIEIGSLEQQLEIAKETIFNLQKQINNVPVTPQIIDITPTKASVSLSEKIAQAKIESIKQFSNFYSDVTFKDGTTKLVHNSELPSLEIPVLPTLEQMASQNVEQSANPEQVTHPSEVQAVDSGAATETTGNGAVHELVQQAVEETTVITLDSLKAEIDALKTAHGERLDRLDKQANLPAVA